MRNANVNDTHKNTNKYIKYYTCTGDIRTMYIPAVSVCSIARTLLVWSNKKNLLHAINIFFSTNDFSSFVYTFAQRNVCIISYFWVDCIRYPFCIYFHIVDNLKLYLYIILLRCIYLHCVHRHCACAECRCRWSMSVWLRPSTPTSFLYFVYQTIS